MTASDETLQLNPLARELNERLEKAAPEVLAMLSKLGRRLYFPKGILTQSAEAGARAHRFNATIGIATEGDGPMVLPSVTEQTCGHRCQRRGEVRAAGGSAGLRELWRDKMLAENPSLAGKRISLPVVTSAITHGLALVGDLFVDPGDCILLPDKLWGNYRLTYEVRLGATIETYPFYDGERLRRRGTRARARVEAAREDHRAAQFPQQSDRLHADRGRGRGDRRGASALRGIRYEGGRGLRRRVLRPVLSPRRSLVDRVVVRTCGERTPEPARRAARWCDQGVVRLGAALRLHQLWPRTNGECGRGRRGARSEASRARSAVASRTFRSCRRRSSTAPSRRRRSKRSASRSTRRCAHARKRSMRSRTRRASARASAPTRSTAAISCASR